MIERIYGAADQEQNFIGHDNVVLGAEPFGKPILFLQDVLAGTPCPVTGIVRAVQRDVENGFRFVRILGPWHILGASHPVYHNRSFTESGTSCSSTINASQASLSPTTNTDHHRSTFRKTIAPVTSSPLNSTT